MLKYKKLMMLVTVFLSLNLLYAFMLSKNIKTASIYTIACQNYITNFVLSIFAFVLLNNIKMIDLTIYKFSSILQYERYKIKEYVMEIGMFFVFVIIGQSMIFMILDPYLNLLKLCYINFVYFLITFLMYMLLFSSKRKNYNRNLCLYFILWNALYFIHSLTPESIINIVNPFGLLTPINSFQLMSYCIVYLIVLYSCIIRMNNRRRNMVEAV